MCHSRLFSMTKVREIAGATYAGVIPYCLGRNRLDGYMSKACRNISASNYAHVLNLVLETLSNYKACPPAGLTQIVHLATRLLKDYPQSTSQQHVT